MTETIPRMAAADQSDRRARADVRPRCSRAWTRAPQAAARAVGVHPVEAQVSGGLRGSRARYHSLPLIGVRRPSQSRRGRGCSRPRLAEAARARSSRDARWTARAIDGVRRPVSAPPSRAGAETRAMRTDTPAKTTRARASPRPSPTARPRPPRRAPCLPRTPSSWRNSRLRPRRTKTRTPRRWPRSRRWIARAGAPPSVRCTAYSPRPRARLRRYTRARTR